MSQENVEIVRRGYELFAEGDLEGVAAFPVRISGRGRASGAKLETRLTHVWVFRNGKVIRGEVYQSSSEALEAVGLSE